MSDRPLDRRFQDRHEAGCVLGGTLSRLYGGRSDVVVLGLPRGGVPVAYEAARALAAPLDVVVVRKLGAPFNPELALGAIASGGILVHAADSVASGRSGTDELERIVARERKELERRERLYRAGRAALDLKGKTAILVDDGIATGATMEAAVEAARAASARSVVVAAPTGSREAVDHLARIADAVEVLHVPDPYMAVGLWYVEFPQLSDGEVLDLLERGFRAQ